MKPLAQMTKDELWACDDESIEELRKEKKIPAFWVTGFDPLNNMKIYKALSVDDILIQLDTRRLELQQAAAESRHDSMQDR